MKKTVTILSLMASAGVAFASPATQADAEMLYMLMANDVDLSSQNFSLAFTIDGIATVDASKNLVELGGGYAMFGQYNSWSQQYIGMRLNGADKSNYSEVNTPAEGGNLASNTYEVADGTVAEAGKPTDKVVGWVTHNAAGTQAPTNFAGATVSINSVSSTTTQSAEIAITTTTVKNIVKNQAAITLGDVKFSNANLTVSGVSVTVGEDTYTMAESNAITSQTLSATAGGHVWGSSGVFNFTIAQDGLVDGAIITAYSNGGDGTGGFSANAFTLKEVNGSFYLAAGDGKLDSDINGTPTTFTASTDADRSITLSAAALEVGKEYTVLIHGLSGDQSVYLFDGKNYLAGGTYNGNMNGISQSTVVGSPLPTYVNAAYQASVPEPATATLSLLALAGLAARRKRK